jgi:thiamine-monophosphate kinase
VSGELPREFVFIDRYLRKLAAPGALGLEDDAAVLSVPAGRELVLSADAMVAGVHFRPDDTPDLVARKLLRTNLSDLAAMGAAPLGYLLTISVPRTTPEAWFAGFAAGLFEDQEIFGIGLLGGDTTSTPGPVSLSLTIVGTVAPGAAMRRRGAGVGDGVWVTGTIGDGALGLAALQGKLDDPTGALAARYRLPQPRLGLKAGIASAAMDISDGLVQDLGHICRASGIAAEIDAASVPRSAAALAAGDKWLATCLTGGDDYELLLAVPAAQEAALRLAFAGLGVPVARIGQFVTGSGVRVNGVVLPERHGWSHF